MYNKQLYSYNIMVFTPHVPVFFWSSRHNFRDIEQKFCLFPQLPNRQLATKLENSSLKNKNFVYLTICHVYKSMKFIKKVK